MEKETIDCICGTKILKKNLARHVASRNHVYITNQIELRKDKTNIEKIKKKLAKNDKNNQFDSESEEEYESESEEESEKESEEEYESESEEEYEEESESESEEESEEESESESEEEYESESESESEEKYKIKLNNIKHPDSNNKNRIKPEFLQLFMYCLLENNIEKKQNKQIFNYLLNNELKKPRIKKSILQKLEYYIFEFLRQNKYVEQNKLHKFISNNLL